MRNLARLSMALVSLIFAAVILFLPTVSFEEKRSFFSEVLPKFFQRIIRTSSPHT